MRFHFHRPLLEFARLLFLAVALIFVIGFAAERTPPPVGFVAGVVIVAVTFFGMAVLLIRGVVVRRKPRPVSKATHEQHEHPVLGRYTTYACDGESRGWSCTAVSEVLGCEVSLWGHSVEPTNDDIERWQKLEKRLPDILAGIPPPPKDDGWGIAPGDFTPSKPHSISVTLKRDSSFQVTPTLVSSERYMLVPVIHIDPEGETWCEGWTF